MPIEFSIQLFLFTTIPNLIKFLSVYISYIRWLHGEHTRKISGTLGIYDFGSGTFNFGSGIYDFGSNIYDFGSGIDEFGGGISSRNGIFMPRCQKHFYFLQV